MMQGDSFRQPIKLTRADNTEITADELSFIEVFIGNIRKTSPEITFENGMFYVPLSQKETFRLKGTVELQARIRFNGSEDVIGIKLGSLDVENSISKVVI